MAPADGFENRISAMIAAAPSQAELARAGGVAGATVGNWRNGLGYHESTVQRFAEKLGVSMSWLRDGIGDESIQLNVIRGKFSGDQDERSARVQEQPDELAAIHDNIRFIVQNGEPSDVRMVEEILFAARRRIRDRKPR